MAPAWNMTTKAYFIDVEQNPPVSLKRLKKISFIFREIKINIKGQVVIDV